MKKIHFTTFIVNSIWAFIIKCFVLQEKKADSFAMASSYQLAKNRYKLKVSLRRNSIDIFLVSLGILSAGFGLKSFLLASHFIDGGATGISLLLVHLTGLPLSLFLLAINFPFVFLGYKIIGKQFALKTAIAITGLAICTVVVPYPIITQDKLLIAVFGGFFLGAGIGFSVRGGAVIDGTEVLAIYLNRKSGLTIGDTILILNLLVFSVAAYCLSIETALYSMLTYLSASKTVDFLIEGIEEYTGVTIISSKSEEIRQAIINQMGRGVTVYNGKRGFGKRGENTDIDIIYTVITRLEVNKLNVELEKIDPNAFVVMNRIKDTKGGMIKKRPLKH